MDDRHNDCSKFAEPLTESIKLNGYLVGVLLTKIGNDSNLAELLNSVNGRIAQLGEITMANRQQQKEEFDKLSAADDAQSAALADIFREVGETETEVKSLRDQIDDLTQQIDDPGLADAIRAKTAQMVERTTKITEAAGKLDVLQTKTPTTEPPTSEPGTGGAGGTTEPAPGTTTTEPGTTPAPGTTTTEPGGVAPNEPGGTFPVEGGPPLVPAPGAETPAIPGEEIGRAHV